MNEIIICDLRFLRDMYEVELLDKVFSLPVSFHTSDFVYDGIVPEECKKKCEEYKEKGLLKIDSVPGKEMDKVLELRSRGISIEDATAWHIAREQGLKALTDDLLLGKCLKEDSIEVIGILDIISLLVEEGLITKDHASKKIDELKRWGRDFSK